MLIIASSLATLKTDRCGAIPYTIIDGKVYFLLTRDKLTKELGDFGGGVRKSECALGAALRELHEESHGIFADIYNSANDIGNNIAVIDNNNKMAIVFIPLENRWFNDAQRSFESNIPTRRRSDEVEELVWINESDLERLLTGRRLPSARGGDVLWTKIRSFLREPYQLLRLALREMALVSA